MDDIYPYQVGKTTVVKDFFDEFTKLGILPHPITKIPETIADFKAAIEFNGSDNDYKKLCDEISIENNLSVPDDIQVFNYDPINFHFRKSSVEFQKQSLKLNKVQEILKKIGSPSYNRNFVNMFVNNSKSVAIPAEKTKPDIEMHSEVLLTVRVYEPFRHIPGVRNRYNPKISQEFNVLGSNYLNELRDKIYCQCNYGPFFDISENPFVKEPTSPMYDSKSGFFFITDTFYNDLRLQTNLDYSNVIISWAETRPEIKPLKKKQMELTQFKDLSFNLAAEQIYQHHGNCEHLFTFSNVQLISKSNSLYRKHYPLLVRVSNPKIKNCNTCGKYEAAFIVTKTTAHILDPTFLCNTCFESYHYIDKKKIGSFEAYRYYRKGCNNIN